MMSTSNKSSSRCSSHIPRKSYGRFDFLVCDWSLQNSSHAAGEKIESKEFVMSDLSKWIVHIFPGGSRTRLGGFVSVQVVLLDLGNNQDSTTATFNISVLHSNGKIFSVRSPCALLFQLGNSWSIDNFISASDLELIYLQNDSVLFTLDIEILGEREWIKSTMPAHKEQCKSLNDDLKELIIENEDSARYSDVTLVADKQQFRCHKVILASRSEVFRQKFQTVNFKYKLMFGGQYRLSNISGVILQEIINFVYTDTCSDEALSMHSKPLLYAAHRFKLHRLIQICEDYVGETLTAETVIDILNMATELKLDRLHTCCSEFISTHERDVIATKTLKNLQADALKDLVVSGILPISAMIYRTEKDILFHMGNIVSAAAKTSAPPKPAKTSALPKHQLEEDEEMKDAIVDSEGTDTNGEKLKTDRDFIPDAGGNRKKEQVV